MAMRLLKQDNFANKSCLNSAASQHVSHYFVKVSEFVIRDVTTCLKMHVNQQLSWLSYGQLRQSSTSTLHFLVCQV